MLNNDNGMQLGVSSVREHMDSLVSKAERFNKRKQALQSQASKLKQALNYERSSDASKKVQEQEGEVAALKAKLHKLEQQEAAGRQARQDQEADLEERVRTRHVHGVCLAGQISSAVGCKVLSTYAVVAHV